MTDIQVQNRPCFFYYQTHHITLSALQDKITTEQQEVVRIYIK
jgi:hypothetical protein